MRFFQTILTEEGVIETTLRDGVTEKEIRAGIARAFELSAEKGLTRFLIDASSANSFIPLAAYYELPAVFRSLNLSRSSRIAVLSSRTQRGKERARFFINVCINRGWQARLFYDRAEALEWLGSGRNEG
jgi:hypothetical protein